MNKNRLYQQKVQCFLSFMEELSLNKTAKALHISQPAITKHLQNFERDFSIPLFINEGRKKVPTAFATKLYQSLSPMIEKQENIINQVIQSYEDEDGITLRIGVRKEIIPRIVDAFNFNGTLEFVILESSDAINHLENRKIDLAITHNVEVMEDLIIRPLFDTSVQLVVHENLINGFSHKEWYREKDFYLNTKALIYKEDPPFYQSWLESIGLSLDFINPSIICDDWNVIAELVSREKGHALIPSDININNKNIKTFLIPRDITKPIQFNLYYHKDLTQIISYKKIIDIAYHRLKLIS